jgi:hypothetical protein
MNQTTIHYAMTYVALKRNDVLEIINNSGVVMTLVCVGILGAEVQPNHHKKSMS